MNKFKSTAIIAVIAISGIIGFKSIPVSKQQPKLSALALANIEALTQQESNNSGSGLYFYNHLKGQPKSCVIYAMYKGGLMIGYTETQGSASTEIIYAKVTGTQESCPRSGTGCTVYSCHVANTN